MGDQIKDEVIGHMVHSREEMLAGVFLLWENVKIKAHLEDMGVSGG
jgi:hypothetical protein